MKFVIFALAVLIVLPAAAQVPQAKPVQSTHSPVASAPSTAATSSLLVNINTASPAELDALPGIGKSRAESIIKNRPYKAKDDLLTRHIIPSNIYNAVKGKIIARQATTSG